MTRPRTTETASPSPRLDARIRQYWSHRATRGERGSQAAMIAIV